jgi:hypothetical protein
LDSSIHIFSVASSTINRLTSLSLLGVSEAITQHIQLDTREEDKDFLLNDVVDLEARRRDDAWIFEVDCGTEQVVEEEEEHDDVLQHVFLCFVVFLLLATVAAVATATRIAASVTPRGVLSLLKVVVILILFEFIYEIGNVVVQLISSE